MLENKPKFILFLLTLCRTISYLFARIQYLLIKSNLLNTPIYIANLSKAELKILQCIWYSRFVRRIISFLIRTPLKKNILKLISFTIQLPKDQGCIIVTCHTPWKRLLVQWCIEKRFALLISGGKWTDNRRTIQRKGIGFTELRGLIKHLKHGGRVIIKAEVFNNLKDCPVNFLGNHYNASLFTERLAILTKVPILTVIPKLTKTSIEFIAGPQFATDIRKFKSTIITTQIISFFEKEIEINPSILAIYVK